MGTQQILMIILSVIVVGAAVAVGISMFDTQADNQDRNAVVSELMQQAVQAQAWFRTPVMMGGCSGVVANFNVNMLPDIIRYVDNNAIATITDPSFRNAVGEFTYAVNSETEAAILITGRSLQKPDDIVVDAHVYLSGVHEDVTYQRGIKIFPWGMNP
jgi:hypothetical protein